MKKHKNFPDKGERDERPAVTLQIKSYLTGNRNKGKSNGASLARESQSHCFADEFGITHAHFFGTDTQYDCNQEIAEQCCQL